MDQNDKNREIFVIVKNVLDAAHQLYKADIEAKSAKDALLSNDSDEMINTISRYANKYEHFVNATTFITGKLVHHISGYYDDKSIEYIRNDVEFCITIVYIKTAFDSGLEEILKRKIQKKFGINELVLEGLSWIN